MPSRIEPCPEGFSVLEHISTHWPVINDPLQFVLRYVPAVRRYVGALVKNAHDSEDVVQDFLLQAVRRPFAREQIRRGRFRDYLKAVLRNAALTHLRRRTNRPSAATDCRAFIAVDTDDTSDREWLAEWRGCLLRRAWRALELHERANPEGLAYTVLRLATDHLQESSAALAARVSELSGRAVGVDAFRKQLSRARRHFAQMLINEVRQTLENDCAEDVVDELRELGLVEFVRDFLPEPFRTAAEGLK